MTANSTLENRLIEKLKKLSLEQIQQVENLIDALSQDNTERKLTVVSTKLSESVFAKIWDNPEDAEYDNL
ncbi:toxin-antitoxin system, antitoxin component, Xre family protein [Moorena sp. SIO2C4]|uniref:toxin-antitoxin system, antitoxin component, Xre family protein n=1 Tax=Moorena sp. SIO2C4 TaxID=2607824 RepID=UPI0013CD1B0A|nr:toxin-antitoxin system, antitoxin component, Xre family protein [Moorena sp. SIO2C4]NES46671.1 toxin-antitoxin system, antitoxin component, Xre family protein [Moorena sp. SIO2C4]